MTDSTFETKMLTPDTHTPFEALHKAFNAFQETNDQRLREIEKRGSSDILLEEKLTRLDDALHHTQKRLDTLALSAKRPPLGGNTHEGETPLHTEHKSAFDLYVRSGENTGLKHLETKALSVSSGPDGGYLAPASMERDVLERLRAISPVRGIATVRTVSVGTYKRAATAGVPISGWVGETAARPETNAATLSELSFPAMELYAMPAATQSLLDDAIVSIEKWLVDEIETVFAEQESNAFIVGNGVNKPRGFLDYPKIANTSWSWGNVGTIKTGTAGSFPADNPSDVLIDLIYALKSGYRQNGAFIMNRKTQSLIRKFKDDNGAYLWQPPASLGQAATLMAFPVVEAEDMPDIAANSHSVAFGDFRRGYLIVDRAGVRVLRDPYSAKPYVMFYTTKRVGGGIQDFDAIKLLQFAS
jgi:HK97 family phage major capsid protein